jgi:microcystin-dependent protein
MHRALITAALIIGSLGGVAQAAPVPFTSRAAFDAAILAFQDQQTVDFGDATATGTLIASGSAFDGITFSYMIDPYTLRITDAFGTTSPPNSLGLNSADDAFLGGDAFDMTFDRPVSALGLYVIGEDIIAGDLTLTIGTGGSVSNGTPDLLLTDGEAFFLGLIDTTSFTTATLSSVPEFYVFNVDDIRTAVAPVNGAVPEPSTLALCVAGAIGLAAWRRRRGLIVTLLVVLAPVTAQAQCLVGEVVFWSGNFAPAGWLPVDGSQRNAGDFPQLATVLGTRYGAADTLMFRLPDLRGRTPLGAGQGAGLQDRPLGPTGGSETVTLTPQQLPPHSHQAIASGNVATSTDPHGNLWAAQSRTPLFAAGGTPAPMHLSAITTVGGDQPHENMSPFLTLTPIICAQGLDPQPR